MDALTFTAKTIDYTIEQSWNYLNIGYYSVKLFFIRIWIDIYLARNP
jgi:hypothetical protein